MTDFFDTDAGRYLIVAKQFMEGALVLDEAQRTHSRGRVLFRPTLALAGQGLEVMLKACMLLNGAVPPTKGRAGHDIAAMWMLDVCEPVRGHVFESARNVADRDRAEGRYPDVVADADVLPLIREYVLELGKLHGQREYPLRYDADPSVQAPRTPFLVRTLHHASECFLRFPEDFELARFHALGMPA